MLSKCDFKMENYACLITAPEDRDILPGRMLRAMIANLGRRYELLEFSCVTGYRAVDEMEDVVGVVEIESGFYKRLFGKQEICVFQKLHPSLYDEHYVQLTEDEIEAFQENMPQDEEFEESDYTVSIPPFYFIAVMLDDSKRIIDIINHIKPKDFSEVRDAVASLCEASISIFDEIEVLVEYADTEVPEMMVEGLDEWIEPPELVQYLDI